jgi:hypothetical protein
MSLWRPHGAADRIGADVRELGGEHRVEQQPAAGHPDALEAVGPPEQQQLGQEVPQQAHVQRPKSVPPMVCKGLGLCFCGNWRRNMPMTTRKITTASHVPSGPPRRPAPGDEDQRHAAGGAPAVEAGDAGGGHHPVELQRHDGRQRGERHRHAAIGQDKRRREQRGEDERGAEEAVLDAGQVHEGAPKRRWRREYSARASAKFGFAEVRPEGVGEVELGVGQLPEQEVAQAQLAAGADHQVGIGHVGQVEVARNRRFVDLRGARARRLDLGGDGADGVGDFGAPAVAEGQDQVPRS